MHVSSTLVAVVMLSLLMKMKQSPKAWTECLVPACLVALASFINKIVRALEFDNPNSTVVDHNM
jgi:hypothetical protein